MLYDRRPIVTRWWQEVFAGSVGTAYASFAQRQETGQRPALLVIDVVRSFVGSPGLDLEAAIAEWPTACGPVAHDALPAIVQLLDASRAAGVPIVHLRPAGPAARILGPAVKNELGGEFVTSRPGAVDFPPQSRPHKGELVVAKSRASAFFDTPVVTYLRTRGVDEVIIVGATTSGCVRASVVDAFSHGFRTFVVEQAVFDRSRLSAAVSLFEMNAKYADVLQLDEAVNRLQRLAQRHMTVALEPRRR
jgi:maleamate amidohydrolase